jgi:hypothetical protein
MPVPPLLPGLEFVTGAAQERLMRDFNGLAGIFRW